ncbi:MAG: single-stranded-DNA-specific exonuclease RecJ [Treponema sp.]|nr:single-stranded-DNA-specific exonuclease RecJ [Treponema sp.]
MNTWHKKNVNARDINFLCDKYDLEKKFQEKSSAQILASIFARRGITEGKDLLYYLEDDLRFQHNPFNFTNMQDAVERILQAKEDGEKILIFGDKDVDGITSTTILYEQLKKMGIDVQWRLPVADDSYGLSIQAVDDFAAQDGSLIITVDCGISNFEEIKHANDLGMEVIITDHHNPPEQLPEAIIIVDPKTEDSGYPFKDISGAAVAYKLVSALRFSQTDLYNDEACLFSIHEDEKEKCFYIDCLKITNLIKIKELHEKLIPGSTSIYDLKFPYFLQGSLIYAWNTQITKKILSGLFGSGIEFNLTDFRNIAASIYPALKNKSEEDLKKLSSLGKYNEEENTTINAFYNLYVTCCRKLNASKHPDFEKDEQKDLQLVALAAMADIMPMKNENRLFVKNGIASIKKNGPRQGLAELFSILQTNLAALTSTELSWSVIPALNAAGRMGQSNLALELMISENPREREQLAKKIFELNEERKDLVSSAFFKIHDSAQTNIEENGGKLCIVADESINKGVTGILAARLMQEFNIPAIAFTFCDDICVGSMRSCRGFVATSFLDSFGDFFINHGGHDCAAGFSFHKSKFNEFLQKARELSQNISLESESQEKEIDAEIPSNYLSPEIMKIVDIFEPYGSENKELTFATNSIPVDSATIVGKKSPQHLKLSFASSKYKFPAMYWSQGERFQKDIFIGEKYNILYNMNRNYFNGIATNQLIIIDLQS